MFLIKGWWTRKGNTMMTKKKVLQIFKEQWRNEVLVKPELSSDKVARSEAWNNYTDSLCKEGLISSKQYHNWTNPF